MNGRLDSQQASERKEAGVSVRTAGNMKRRKRNIRIPVSFGMALAVCLLCVSGLFYTADNRVSDALYQQQRSSSGEIVVIGIDSKTLNRMGNPMQWSRGEMARVIRHLNSDPENRPAVIGIDMLFSADSRIDPEGDRELAAACAEYGNVVVAGWANYGTEIIRDADSWAMVHGVVEWEEPFSLLRDSAEAAHANGVLDADRILRHGQLWIRKPDGEKVNSLAWTVYERYCAYQGINPNPAPPVTKSGLFYIRYSVPHTFYEDSWTFLKCLDSEIHSPRLKGKIVLIGGYALKLADEVYTSLDPGRMMYGVEAQANMIDGFIRGDYFREAGGPAQAAALFVFAFLAALLLWNRKTVPAMLIWLPGCGAWIGGCLLLRQWGIVAHVLWGPAAITLEFAAMILMNYTRAYLARLKTEKTFGRYVDPAVIRELMDNNAAQDLGGKLCRIAVLFVDIRGFTALSESLPAPEVVEILNRYLSLTTECVMRNKGTLDKFVGDCTMAVWGAPVPAEDPAGQACRAALEMMKGAHSLDEELEKQYGRRISFGIGIHYGPAVVGNIGAPMRMDYTAIGDTVNTASRLEANAPGGTILISGDVRDELGNRAVTSAPESEIRLKGKNEKIGIFVLEDLKEKEGQEQ